jgi:hypothetical protein
MDKFDEYKFFAEATAELASRRQNATEVYLSVNTAVFALIAFLLKDVGIEGRLLALLALPLFAVGVFACAVWYKLIYRYKCLIAWRYEQLMQMESALPDSHRMYTKEWTDFFQPHEAKQKFGFSTLEVWLPRVILVLYVVYGGAFLVAKALAPAP